MNLNLVGESHLFAVSDLIQVGNACEVNHWRRSAHQNDGVVARRRQVTGEHALAHEANIVFPTCRSVEST